MTAHKLRCLIPAAILFVSLAHLSRGSLPGPGQAPSVQAGVNEEATPEHFRAFRPLVGRTWEAELAGGSLRDRQTFSWVFEGKFLRNVHAVSKPDGQVIYEGETIYAWDAPARRLVWWYWNSTGGYVTGEVRVEENLIHAEGVNHAGGQQTQRVKSVFELEEDLWHSTSFFWRDGDFVEQGVATFTPVE